MIECHARLFPPQGAHGEETRLFGGEEGRRDPSEPLGAGEGRRAAARLQVGREPRARHGRRAGGVVAAEEAFAVRCHRLHAVVARSALIGLDGSQIPETVARKTADPAAAVRRRTIQVKPVVDRVADDGASVDVVWEEMFADDVQVLVPHADHALPAADGLAQGQRAVEASVRIRDVAEVDGSGTRPNQAPVPADLVDAPRMRQVDALRGTGRALHVPDDAVELAGDRVDRADTRGSETLRGEARRQDGNKKLLHAAIIAQRPAPRARNRERSARNGGSSARQATGRPPPRGVRGGAPRA